MARLTWESVLAWRMRRQHLAERVSTRRALAVVSDLCGLHAQVTSSAELTLWARVDGLKRGWMEDQLWKRRRLVKTWAMRGTLHLLRADELALYTGALARLRPRYEVPAWQRHFGVTQAQAEAMLAAVAAELAGPPRTRAELAAGAAARAGNPALEAKLARGFGELLKPAAFTGDLCFAPPDGQRVRFTRPADWLEGFAHAGPDEPSAHEVVRRYLRAYGPAPREQFQRWFGMTSPAEAGRWLKALGDAVEEVDVEGTRGWMLAADVGEAAAAEPPGVVRLLPAFDHHVVAAPRGAAAVLPAGRRADVYRPQGWLSPVILADGRMAGTWEHAVERGAARVTLRPFGRLAAWQRAGAEAEAERLAAFLGAPLSLGSG